MSPLTTHKYHAYVCDKATDDQVEFLEYYRFSSRKQHHSSSEVSTAQKLYSSKSPVAAAQALLAAPSAEALRENL